MVGRRLFLLLTTSYKNLHNLCKFFAERLLRFKNNVYKNFASF